MGAYPPFIIDPFLAHRQNMSSTKQNTYIYSSYNIIFSYCNILNMYVEGDAFTTKRSTHVNQRRYSVCIDDKLIHIFSLYICSHFAVFNIFYAQ